MKIINETKGTVLAENVIVANTFFGRIIGLLNRSEILPGEALLIRPCNSVHTFFMKFPIDVVFVSKDHRILITIPNMKTLPFFSGCFRKQICARTSCRNFRSS